MDCARDTVAARSYCRPRLFSTAAVAKPFSAVLLIHWTQLGFFLPGEAAQGCCKTPVVVVVVVVVVVAAAAAAAVVEVVVAAATATATAAATTTTTAAAAVVVVDH